MPCCRRISHDFPEGGLDQHGRPPGCETASDLGDAGDFAPRPALVRRQRNLRKGRKARTPGMQEDQIVVALSSESLFSPNPEDTALEACQPTCGFRFGEVAIPPFVILHA